MSAREGVRYLTRSEFVSYDVCDSCGKETLRADYLHRREPLPNDQPAPEWIQLARRVERSTTTWDFCSIGCLLEQVGNGLETA